MNTKTKPSLDGLDALNTRHKSPEKPVESVKANSGRSGRTTQEKPSRVGTVHVGAYFPPEVRTQLKMIALEQDKTAQQLIGEALNGLFITYGKPEIAPTDRA